MEAQSLILKYAQLQTDSAQGHNSWWRFLDSLRAETADHVGYTEIRERLLRPPGYRQILIDNPQNGGHVEPLVAWRPFPQPLTPLPASFLRAVAHRCINAVDELEGILLAASRHTEAGIDLKEAQIDLEVVKKTINSLKAMAREYSSEGHKRLV
jgi:hypothetical protein